MTDMAPFAGLAYVGMSSNNCLRKIAPPAAATPTAYAVSHFNLQLRIPPKAPIYPWLALFLPFR